MSTKIKFFVISIFSALIVMAVCSENWCFGQDVKSKLAGHVVKYTLICQDSVTGEKHNGGVYTDKTFAIKDLRSIQEKMYTKKGHIFEHYVEEGQVFVYHIQISNGEKIW